jgi:hypothetical protein
MMPYRITDTMGQDYSVVHPALLLVGLLYLQYNHVKLARWKPGMKIRSNAVARIRIILYTSGSVGTDLAMKSRKKTTQSRQGEDHDRTKERPITPIDRRRTRMAGTDQSSSE